MSEEQADTFARLHHENATNRQRALSGDVLRVKGMLADRALAFFGLVTRPYETHGV